MKNPWIVSIAGYNSLEEAIKDHEELWGKITEVLNKPWEQHKKDEYIAENFAPPHYEISVVQEFNTLGRESWGHEGDGKMVVSLEEGGWVVTKENLEVIKKAFRRDLARARWLKAALNGTNLD